MTLLILPVLRKFYRQNKQCDHTTLLPFLLDPALLDCVIDRKVPDITSEAILGPTERYQNIQDNPEYNSVLPFRIILKIFAVNML